MEKCGTGDERLAAICQMIRNETLDPAKEEAEQIRHAAERDAAKIRSEAKRQADHMLHEARTLIKEEREAFDVSLEQAARQTVGLLKEKIEKSLLHPGLEKFLADGFRSEAKTARLLDLLIQEIQKEGLDGDVSVWLGKHLSKEEVLKHISQDTLKSVSSDNLLVGEHAYGIVLKIVDRHLSIEVTPEAIKEMMAAFIRSDFRSILFSE
jgi:V/A-type H+/Na+-transporting ATPase subunit E